MASWPAVKEAVMKEGASECMTEPWMNEGWIRPSSSKMHLSPAQPKTHSVHCQGKMMLTWP